jgi:general secretion pathway protein F
MAELLPTFSKAFRWGQELPWRALRRLETRFHPLLFLTQLSSMLRSGLPLAQALGFVSDEFSGAARRRISQVRERVEAGTPLSAALRALPRRWAPPVALATVEAGERSGRLPELLDELAMEVERLNDVTRKVRAVLVYPVAVLLIAACLFAVVGHKVMRVFEALYTAPGTEMPAFASVVLPVWDVLALPAGILLTVVLVALLAGDLFPRTPLSRAGRWLAWRMPLVAGLRRSLIEVRFARTLRVLLDAGLSLPDALQVCERVVADERAGVVIINAVERIRAGEKPSEVLRQLGFLSPAFVWFLSGSEQRGDFLEVTRAMADTALEQFQTRVELLQRLLEPVAVVLLAAVVGTAVIAIYQVMFELGLIVTG